MSDTENETLEFARKRTAEHLNIDLSEPQQEKRIEALNNLYKRYSEGIDVKSLIYKEISDSCEKLIEIHKEQQRQLNELKISTDSFSNLKIKMENIEFKFKGEISELEKKIKLNQKLLSICDSKYSDYETIDAKYRKKLKELEDKCWDNWLRAIDVNRELRNTIIGFENRKALLAISKLYIDYHILANSEVSKCFLSLKEEKKDGIKKYYEILAQYQLPLEKRIDFKAFLQKMIESGLSDAMEVKTILNEFADTQRSQIDSLIEEVREQYRRDQEDMISIVNFHKQNLLNKQVLFTNESEQLVIYFKKRYINKIDLLCSRFQMYHSEAGSESRNIQEEKLVFFKKILKEEFDKHLNQLKMEYSKKAIPLLDNFWHLEKNTSNAYALDEFELNEKLKNLKISKNLGMKSLIASFEEKRAELKERFDKKLNLIEDINKIEISKFDAYLKQMKDECEVLCSEIINTNARFWTKVGAEFNCIFRQYFVKLRYQYAPYIDSWRAGCKSWMNEYLQTNLNQEFLRAVGECLEGVSAESSFYKKISRFLMKYNEKIRSILVERDNMEVEQLLALNTLPVADSENLKKDSMEKLNLRQDCYTSFLEDYNSFYKEQLTR